MSSVNACREAVGLSALRDRLGLGFREFNATLTSLGPPYKPFQNRDGQLLALQQFVASDIDNVLGQLRLRWLPVFDDRGVLDAYEEVRAPDVAISADDYWVDACELPSDEMMRKRVDQWLTDHGCDVNASWSEVLEPIHQLRTANFEALRAVLDSGRPRAIAWCGPRDVPVPEVFSTRSSWPARIHPFSTSGGWGRLSYCGYWRMKVVGRSACLRALT